MYENVKFWDKYVQFPVENFAVCTGFMAGTHCVNGFSLFCEVLFSRSSHLVQYCFLQPFSVLKFI